jgi:S-adenosylmethionine:tRNA ribosyltransferase-isomerase
LAVFLKDFEFELPKTAIALRPASPRDAARLLVAGLGNADAIAEAQVRDLPAYLKPGDVMVFNNTKVLPAVLVGRRPSRGAGAPAAGISLTLLERHADGSWSALARPARRLRPGDLIILQGEGQEPALKVIAKNADGLVTVGPAQPGRSVEALMAEFGTMPLPPYIARDSDKQDFADYQTVYASVEGAVAAPTAGLHFTPELFQRLRAKGIRTAFVTLHVGPGTFLPVKTEKVEEHRMHAERCEIAAEAADIINEGRNKGGRIVAVGTTSLRLLETAAKDNGTVAPYCGETQLFIKPGHRFRAVDVLFTNFHLPKSTLFMLVCAFAGTKLMKQAYAHAIETGFRFYSYGDACLLHRAAEGEIA